VTTTSSSSSSSSATSGILTSLGLGSGLDISSLVSQLTTAEMSAANSRVSRETSAVNTQVSAMASLKAGLSTFQASLDALTAGATSSSSFDSRAVTSSADTYVTATATSKAAVGSYDVFVQQMAKAQQLVSNVFAQGASQQVGTGTLSLSLGSSNFTVDISSSNNTLTGIRDAINSASNNPGISATIVYGTTGAQLLLTSSKTGASNTITVDQSGGDGGLSALVYNGTTTGNYTEKQQAKDSIIQVAGVTHQSSSNVISDAVDGLTLTLKKENVSGDTPANLSVSNDTSHVTSLVQSFVSAYNTLLSSLSSLDSYDADTKTAGPLFGDSMMSSLRNQISSTLSSVVGSSTYNTLASLGVTRALDGTLSVDSSKLSSAMTADYASVVKTLGGTDGIITKLSSIIDSQLSSSGGIAARNTTLNTQQKNIDAEKTAITARTATVQAQLLTKFNAMDTLLGTLQNTSTYLTQQFNALNKSSNS